MASNYYNKLYNDYEKTQEKLDAVLCEISNIRKEHKKEINKLQKEFKLQKQELIETINSLTKQLEAANKQNEKLLNEIDRLKNKNDKNSTNSSKPSSSDITTPKKKTGANLYNYRIKTNNKIGGQLGHNGHNGHNNLNKETIEEMIKNNDIKVIEKKHTIKGNPKLGNIVKYKIGIKFEPYIEKHIFIYDENSKEILSKDFYTDVTYTNDIKALSIELGTHNLISYDRLSEFFSVITNNVINISKGTLVNFLYEFSSKSKLTINNLENDILNSKTNLTDETSANFNKKNLYVRNYSNEKTVIYKVHHNKGHKPILEDNILPRFCGVIMADHDTTLYSYGTKRYECNIHLGRYLEELIQNVKDISWPANMKELIFRMHNTRKMAVKYGAKGFDKQKVKEYEKYYDEILELSKRENKEIKSSFYKEKANKLYRRLRKYKKQHLYFIKDFDVPFDNNMSERDLRCFKNKTKISGGFRTMRGAKSYVDALTIIKTSIKRNINPFETIKSIFNNEILFQN